MLPHDFHRAEAASLRAQSLQKEFCMHWRCCAVQRLTKAVLAGNVYGDQRKFLSSGSKSHKQFLSGLVVPTETRSP
jgi:hypothetical protein